MAKTKINSFDELAKAMEVGFKRADVKLDEKIDNLAKVTHQAFIGLEEKISKRFDLVDEKLNHIENIILDQHRERIGHLEDRVTQLESDFRYLVSGKK